MSTKEKMREHMHKAVRVGMAAHLHRIGHTTAEIAERLKLPESTIRAWIPAIEEYHKQHPELDIRK